VGQVAKKAQVGTKFKNNAPTVRKCARETTARARAVNAQNDRGGRHGVTNRFKTIFLTYSLS